MVPCLFLNRPFACLYIYMSNVVFAEPELSRIIIPLSTELLCENDYQHNCIKLYCMMQ